MPPKHDDRNGRASSAVGACPWAPLAVLALVSAFVACGLTGQRGLYSDDYLHRLWIEASPPGGAHWAQSLLESGLSPRPLAYLSGLWLVSLVPQAEVWGRLAVAALALANAALLGTLARRLLRSRLAAAVSAALYVVPVVGYAALLWSSAAGYVVGSCCALVCLHAAWRALDASRRGLAWAALAAVAYGALLLTNESLAATAALVAILGSIAAAGGTAPRGRAPILRSVLLTALLALLCVAVYLGVYRESWALDMRGGLDLRLSSLLGKAGELSRAWLWLAALHGWDLAIERTLAALGGGMLAATSGGWLLGVLALGALLVASLRWPPEARRPDTPQRAGAGVAALGLAWAVLPALFPSALLPDQGLASRMLYYPWGGVALLAGAAAAWIARRARGPAVERVLVALAGLALLGSALVTCGLARGYAARSDLDRRQLTLLAAAAPGEALPAGTVFVPLGTDETLPGEVAALSHLYLGVLEAPWSATPALALTYGRGDLQCVPSNRWTEPTLALGEAPGTLVVQGTVVPLDRALPFTHRAEGVRLVGTLTAEGVDGRAVTVELPLVAALGAREAPGR